MAETVDISRNDIVRFLRSASEAWSGTFKVTFVVTKDWDENHSVQLSGTILQMGCVNLAKDGFHGVICLTSENTYRYYEPGFHRDWPNKAAVVETRIFLPIAPLHWMGIVCQIEDLFQKLLSLWSPDTVPAVDFTDSLKRQEEMLEHNIFDALDTLADKFGEFKLVHAIEGGSKFWYVMKKDKEADICMGSGLTKTGALMQALAKVQGPN